MGGYDEVLKEDQPVFKLPLRYVLQSWGKTTGWKFHAEYHSLEDGKRAAQLEIGYNNSLKMRIQNSLNGEVLWKSNKLDSFLDLQVDTSDLGGI